MTRAGGLKRRHLALIDLFSGAGGLSLGAARAGFSVKGAVEIDAHVASTHELNFPRTEHLRHDISKLTGESLLQEVGLKHGELAGIIGGPPCQGFSCIGKRDAADPRNNLFGEFFRLVNECQPKFFLAENVPGILNAWHDAIREEALSRVADKYTILEPLTICAKDYGAPTSRTRVFFVGYKKDELGEITEETLSSPPDAERITVGMALSGLPIKVDPDWQTEEDGWRVVETRGNTFFSRRLRGCIPAGVGDPYALARLRKEGEVSGCLGTRHSIEVKERYAAIEPGKRDAISKSHRLDLNDFCPTLRAGTGPGFGRFQAVRPLHPTEPRVITPREAARLQGFPDWFRFSSTKWHSFRGIGSSVSPILAEQLLIQVRRALDEDGRNDGCG